MKILTLLLLFLCPFWAAAQHPSDSTLGRFFDPEKQPIATQNDSIVTLVISEYLIAKSIETRLGTSCQITKIYKVAAQNGSYCLVCEGIWKDKSRQPFTLAIPLIPDSQLKYLYAASQALICSSPGCNNCTIQNGHCVGCCSINNEEATNLALPMIKISTKIE